MVKRIDVLLFNGESNVSCVRASDYDALAAELRGYKESHEKYCPTVARIRELEAREAALAKFAEFCDYHHRSCDGIKGQHLDCDCGYTEARDELHAALASQSDRGKKHGD